ncbi:MAG: metallophosphoesterase family protein [Pseudomonadota bacterium]
MHPRLFWIALALLLTTRVLAAPSQLRVSVVDDPRTSMGIAWTTPDLVDSVVRYGTSASYGLEQTGSAPSLAQDIGYIHGVTLTGLSAGTTYHYSVGDGSEWSDDATFATSGSDPCAAWSFVAMGDDRTQFGTGGHPGVSSNFPEILVEAADTGPALIINTGDLVMDGEDEAQWVDYLDSTELVGKEIPIFPVIGNHDTDSVEGDGANFNKIFYLPRNTSSSTEDFYVVRYRNAVFAVLSTHSFRGGSTTDSRAFAQQAEWLDQVLTQNSDATWKIVSFHAPAFTGGGGGLSHPPNEAGANEVLLPLLDAHHVDFVLTGHNHYYERFAAAVQGTDLTRGEPNPDGTVHITTGGAGAYTMEIGSFSVCFGDVGGTRAGCSGRHHFVNFQIADGTLTMETWATRCQNFGCADSNVELLDTLTIVKPGSASCGGGADAGIPDSAIRSDAATAADIADPGDAVLAVDGSATTPDAAAQFDASAPLDAGIGLERTSTDVVQVVADAAAWTPQDAAEPFETVSPGCGCGLAGRGPVLEAILGVLALWVLRRRSHRRAL